MKTVRDVIFEMATQDGEVIEVYIGDAEQTFSEDYGSGATDVQGYSEKWIYILHEYDGMNWVFQIERNPSELNGR